MRSWENPDGALPPSKKKNGSKAAADNDVGIFGHHEKTETHTAIFSKVAGNQFTFRLTKIEGGAICFSQGTDKKDEERKRHEN